MASCHLTYFHGRGRAEVCRLVMAATGIKWTQEGMDTKAQFEALKKEKLLFGQLPLIEIEGKRLVQAQAIARYFARRGGIAGQTPDEAVKIDMLYEGTRDLNSDFLTLGFAGYQPVLDKIKATAMPKYLPIFNRVLTENGNTGYLVGNKLTLADVGLLEPILAIEELMGAKELEPYPAIQKFLSVMKANENIAKYLSSSLRYPNNDDTYVKTVMAVVF